MLIPKITFIKSIKRNGKSHARTKTAENNLGDLFLELRLSPKFIVLLTDNLRDFADRLRDAPERGRRHPRTCGRGVG